MTHRAPSVLKEHNFQPALSGVEGYHQTPEMKPAFTGCGKTQNEQGL
jgi:hypothetical protein